MGNGFHWLDTFVIVLTQTTKEKGKGDIPIDKDGAYGVSQYENMVDYMITIWQPLMRVQHKLDKYFLAWQYAKVRNKHENDLVKPYSHKLLLYDMTTGDLRSPSSQDFALFQSYIPEVIELRKAMKEHKELTYSRCMNEQELSELSKKLENL